MHKSTLDGFVKIDEITSFYRGSGPGENGTVSMVESPDLIVLCTWMSAAPKHIKKYTEGYQRLFPHASILVLESSLSGTFFRPDLTPACEVLESFVQNDGSSSLSSGRECKVVLQAFSNGGGFNATRLAQRVSSQKTRVQFDRVILDCCPGKPEVNSGTRAITLSLPNRRLIRTIAPYLIYPLLILWMVVDKLFRLESFISRLRRRLNDEALFASTVPRLYLYSDGDALVESGHVHEHAEDARAKGYTAVREERFPKAPHCALPIEDFERYWSTLKAHILDSDDRREKSF